jgi:patatin-like phospholipase/acyl hydrolase
VSDSQGRSFKILSLDGGGIRGAFAASVLAAVEEQCGAGLAEYFDLIAGTSTGGIIALGSTETMARRSSPWMEARDGCGV